MDSAEDRLADSLLASARALVAMAVRTVDDGPMPVTLVQHRVLLLIEEAGGLSVNGLTTRLAVNQSNASRHCTRLVELGLLDRSPSAKDRRSVELRLTPAGRRQVLAVRQARREWATTVLARLPGSQTREVVRGLELLASAAHDVTAGEGAPLL